MTALQSIDDQFMQFEDHFNLNLFSFFTTSIIHTIMKIQWNIVNVFNSHYTSYDVSNSDIKSIELCKEIRTLKKDEESDLYAVLQYIWKIS